MRGVKHRTDFGWNKLFLTLWWSISNEGTKHTSQGRKLSSTYSQQQRRFSVSLLALHLCAAEIGELHRRVLNWCRQTNERGLISYPDVKSFRAQFYLTLQYWHSHAWNIYCILWQLTLYIEDRNKVAHDSCFGISEAENVSNVDLFRCAEIMERLHSSRFSWRVPSVSETCLQRPAPYMPNTIHTVYQG